MEVNTYESCTGTVQLDQLPVLNLIMYSDAGTQSSRLVIYSSSSNNKRAWANVRSYYAKINKVTTCTKVPGLAREGSIGGAINANQAPCPNRGPIILSESNPLCWLDAARVYFTNLGA
jgi:hypothetical protein